MGGRRYGDKNLGLAYFNNEAMGVLVHASSMAHQMGEKFTNTGHVLLALSSRDEQLMLDVFREFDRNPSALLKAYTSLPAIDEEAMLLEIRLVSERVPAAAWELARSLGQASVAPGSILAVIAEFQNGRAVALLRSAGVTPAAFGRAARSRMLGADGMP